MMVALSFQPVAFAAAVLAAVAILIFLIVDAHKNKKNRHRGRWK
jgi:hypothetical protein